MSPYIIGLTGPTGAGKSTVTSLLEEAGFPSVSADRLAREVVLPGSPGLARLCGEFGQEILAADGSLDRPRLASIAFSTREGTRRLNEALHPLILRRMDEETERLAASGAGAVVWDASQLFESGADKDCDVTVAVLADDAVRLGRIMARDGIGEEAARLRMAAGLKEDFYLAHAARILYNNGDFPALAEQVRALEKTVRRAMAAREALL